MLPEGPHITNLKTEYKAIVKDQGLQQTSTRREDK